MRGFGLPVARQQQQRTGEPFLARVEELIDQILLDADVPRQHVREEAIRERGPGVELTDHVGLLDADDRGARHRRRGRHPPRLARQAALAEKVTRLEDGDDGLFAGVREH